MSFDFQKFNWCFLSHLVSQEDGLAAVDDDAAHEVSIRTLDQSDASMHLHEHLAAGAGHGVPTLAELLHQAGHDVPPAPGLCLRAFKGENIGCYVKNILVFCCHLPFSSTGSARQSIMTWVCLSKKSSAFLHLSDTTTTTLMSGFSDTSRMRQRRICCMRQWMVCPWRWVLVSLQSFHHLASDLLDLGHALPRNLAPIPDVLLEAEEDLRQLLLLSLMITFLQEYSLISCLQDLIKPPSASKSCAIISCLLVSCWHLV